MKTRGSMAQYEQWVAPIHHSPRKANFHDLAYSMIARGKPTSMNWHIPMAWTWPVRYLTLRVSKHSLTTLVPENDTHNSQGTMRINQWSRGWVTCQGDDIKNVIYRLWGTPVENQWDPNGCLENSRLWSDRMDLADRPGKNCWGVNHLCRCWSMLAVSQ